MSSINEVIHYSHTASGLCNLWRFLEGTPYRTFAGYAGCLHLKGDDHALVLMEGDILYWWEDENRSRRLAVYREDW